MKNNTFIITFTIVFISVLYFVDAILTFSYASKVATKVILLVLSFVLGKKIGLDFTFLKFKGIKQYKKGIIFSVISFSSITIGFFIIKSFLDIPTLVNEFTNKYELVGLSFLIASIYLVFINSFLEEFFFRGFIFLNMKNKYLAYGFSSVAFSIYHISNFQNWFNNNLIIVFPVIGLILSGLIFNYLDHENKDIYNSYFPHLFADLAIVIIGFLIIC